MTYTQFSDRVSLTNIYLHDRMVNSSPFVFRRISPVITTQYPIPLSGLSADVSSLSLRDKISQNNIVVKEKVKSLKTDVNIRKEILEIFFFHISLW